MSRLRLTAGSGLTYVVGLVLLLGVGCSAPSAPVATSAPAPAQKPAGAVDKALIDAAMKEGTIVWYTSVDTTVAEQVAKAFETKYSGMKVEVNRTGSERVMQRVMQEAQAGVKAADVIHTSDAGNFVELKEQKMLLKYTPAAIEKYPASFRDKDGLYYAWRSSLGVPGYNPKLIDATAVPKTWQDLLDPKWKGKMVSAHPGYSGSVVTWEAAIVELYKTDYLDALAKQDVMLVQSAADPVTKVTSGERPLAINGTDYSYFINKTKGNPVEVVYPSDGAPLITSPSAIAADAPHPNAAKLFTEYAFDVEAQQILVDNGLYSGHAEVRYTPGRKKLTDLKLLIGDDVKLQQQADQLKKAFTRAFGS